MSPIRAKTTSVILPALLLLGCGASVRSSAERCEASPSLMCSGDYARYEAQDPAGARESYGRMTQRMREVCDALMNASHDGRTLPEDFDVTNAAFMCLRVAALELGAAGIDAGRIGSDISRLDPNAVPPSAERGLAKLHYLCGLDMEVDFDGETYGRVTRSGASTEACYMLGDIGWARFDGDGAEMFYAHKCEYEWGGRDAEIETCIERAPSRSEARWLSPGVRTVLDLPPEGTPRPAHAASTRRARTEAARAEASRPAAATASPVPAGWPCIGRWTGRAPDTSGAPMRLALELDANALTTQACGRYEQVLEEGTQNEWRLGGCAFTADGLASERAEGTSHGALGAIPLVPLRISLTCRGDEATLVTQSEGRPERRITLARDAAAVDTVQP